MNIIVANSPSNVVTDHSAYVSLVKQGLLTYAYTLSNYEKLGKTEVSFDRVRLTLLYAYVEIIDDYFNGTVDLEWADVESCMIHINNLLKTDYWLEQ